MILEELIERIRMIATGLAKEPVNPKMLDTEVLVELILPRVIQLITADIVKDSEGLNALRADHTLTFSLGAADFPTTIKEPYIESIYFPTHPYASYCPRYEDFSLQSSKVDTFTIYNGMVRFREPGLSVTDFSGTLTMNAITLPELPALITDEVEIKDYILDKIIIYASNIINQTVPLAATDV